MNKIREIYNWYKEFNNKEIIIQTENKNLEIKINEKALPHLLGIHYIDPKISKRTGSQLIEFIKNHSDDNDSYNLILKNNPYIFNNVQNRIDNFREFMENLENAILVENTYNSMIKSQHFL